jgi:LacI family transcriptional regulator
MPTPLGLMTANDDWGSQATALCHRIGRRVPDDIAVVGVDDDDLVGGEMANPPLSSVAHLTDRIGQTGAEMLIRLIHGLPVPAVTLVPAGPLIARQSSQSVAVDDELVVLAIRTMELQLAKAINIDELLRTLNVSRRALELRFRHALGRTPGAELQRLRIERAKLLLSTTRQPIAEVSRLSGFTNATRLNDAFRRHVGTTPSAYRKQLTVA